MLFFTTPSLCLQRPDAINKIPHFNYQLNAQPLYSITIRMLHYNPRHISSINTPIFRRTNCIIKAAGIVTLCKRLYSIPDESRTKELCNKLVIEISLYYDARSKKHQTKYLSSINSELLACVKVWGDKEFRVHLSSTKQKLQLREKLRSYAL